MGSPGRKRGLYIRLRAGGSLWDWWAKSQAEREAIWLQLEIGWLLLRLEIGQAGGDAGPKEGVELAVGGREAG